MSNHDVYDGDQYGPIYIDGHLDKDGDVEIVYENDYSEEEFRFLTRGHVIGIIAHLQRLFNLEAK